MAKKKFKWYEQPFRWANIVLIVLTLLSYLTSYINPNFAGWLSILGLTYPILLFFNVGFLIFWLYRKKAILAFSTFLCILIGWNYLTATIGMNYFSSMPQATEQQLSLVSYNTRNFRTTGKFEEKKAINRINETLKFIPEIKPDIFCGQEFRLLPTGKMSDTKNNYLSHFSHIADNKKGIIICSKYPIINQGKVDNSDSKRHTNLFADIQINNQFIVRVYSVHLESNKVSKTTENIELDTEKLQTKSTWRTIFRVLDMIKNNQKLRAEQIKAITKHAEGSPYPVIICGDFNDTPLSYTVRQTNFLQDNFSKSGKGMGTTYNGNIPFLRIDYILSDRRFNVVKTNIMKEYKASDHFPMKSIVSWEFEE